jgi:hypothetical protein
LDVARIFRIVRTHIRALKGWEVVERAVLGTFSFTKYLMWKELEERSDAIKLNPVVKHLIETPTQIDRGSDCTTAPVNGEQGTANPEKDGMNTHNEQVSKELNGVEFELGNGCPLHFVLRTKKHSKLNE